MNVVLPKMSSRVIALACCIGFLALVAIGMNSGFIRIRYARMVPNQPLSGAVAIDRVAGKMILVTTSLNPVAAWRSR